MVLKFLPGGLAHDREAMERFRCESKAASSLPESLLLETKALAVADIPESSTSGNLPEFNVLLTSRGVALVHENASL